MTDLHKLIAAAVLAMVSTSALATVDTYQDGDTTLIANQDGFAIEVREANDAGNSVRVYVRPRNGNCVTANTEQVTYAGYKAVDGIPLSPLSDSEADVDWTATLHDNPMCSTNKWEKLRPDCTSTANKIRARAIRRMGTPGPNI